ncbi:MAG: leucine--tRNA ligase [Candidatus Nitrosopolaris sp.]
MINTNNNGKQDNKKWKGEKNRINWNSIEEKWRCKWDVQRIFQADPDFAKKKYFITVAYPYPNSPQHIGHGRTYTLADVHARYMRMKGYNVLFPMGFHYTGTPILAMSRRVASRDRELLETFDKIYHVPTDAITSFVEPGKIASFFHNEIRGGMKEMGFSIDWRREFSTIDKVYSKFISWQFRTLRKKGLIVQGSHPVGWCPNDQNPVSQHDTIGDVEPSFNEYTVIKFRLNDGYIIPTATLRPETIYGATNLWVNPSIEYVRIYLRDKDERWILSNEAAIKLRFLGNQVTIESHVLGKEMIGTLAKNPVTHASLPIYPASFVDADSGTGFVMSVPAHAPYDYQALEDLKNNISIQKEFGIKFEVKPITVIESDDYSGVDVIPSKEVINKFNIQDQTDTEIEKATNELYSHEFYKGKMLQNTGKYAGMSVSEAKDKVKNDILTSGDADIMFELINKPVKCRCGTQCVVKLLNDQWFLNYGNVKWKYLAHECVNNMEIVPEEIRQEFNYVIDWLRERACARQTGLGTKLPWDQHWIIESLSDSVIYMAYYILAKYVNDKSINDADDLKDTVFDYVFLGKGNLVEVASDCNISTILLEQIRKEFSYFYPVDSRHSGRDLVPNHLSFFIFNHVAIFDRDNWPKQIVVNGSVLMEGKKMSKSLGNIIPLREAVKKHSADAIRLSMLISAELLQDADFSFDTVKGIQSKLQDIYYMGIGTITNSSPSQIQKAKIYEELEDRWLLSRLQRTIADTTISMDKLRVREAAHNIIYSLDHDLQWYEKRAKAKNRERDSIQYTLSRFLNTRIKMLAPFAPFISEELWERIDNSSASITFTSWPTVEENKKDIVAEESEQLIMNLIFDLHKIVKVTGINPKKIIFYTGAHWKLKIYYKILSIIFLESNTNFGDIMKQLIKDPETANAKTNSNMVKKMIEDILSDPIETRKRRVHLENFEERLPIEDARNLLALEGGSKDAEILVYSEDDTTKYDPKSKAKFARPFKPAIHLVN